MNKQTRPTVYCVDCFHDVLFSNAEVDFLEYHELDVNEKPLPKSDRHNAITSEMVWVCKSGYGCKKNKHNNSKVHFHYAHAGA